MQQLDLALNLLADTLLPSAISPKTAARFLAICEPYLATKPEFLIERLPEIADHADLAVRFDAAFNTRFFQQLELTLQTLQSTRLSEEQFTALLNLYTHAPLSIPLDRLLLTLEPFVSAQHASHGLSGDMQTTLQNIMLKYVDKPSDVSQVFDIQYTSRFCLKFCPQFRRLPTNLFRIVEPNDFLQSPHFSLKYAQQLHTSFFKAGPPVYHTFVQTTCLLAQKHVQAHKELIPINPFLLFSHEFNSITRSHSMTTHDAFTLWHTYQFPFLDKPHPKRSIVSLQMISQLTDLASFKAALTHPLSSDLICTPLSESTKEEKTTFFWKCIDRFLFRSVSSLSEVADAASTLQHLHVPTPDSFVLFLLNQRHFGPLTQLLDAKMITTDQCRLQNEDNLWHILLNGADYKKDASYLPTRGANDMRGLSSGHTLLTASGKPAFQTLQWLLKHASNDLQRPNKMGATPIHKLSNLKGEYIATIAKHLLPTFQADLSFNGQTQLDVLRKRMTPEAFSHFEADLLRQGQQRTVSPRRTL
jgi:hypothetical protein